MMFVCNVCMYLDNVYLLGFHQSSLFFVALNHYPASEVCLNSVLWGTFVAQRHCPIGQRGNKSAANKLSDTADVCL